MKYRELVNERLPGKLRQNLKELDIMRTIPQAVQDAVVLCAFKEEKYGRESMKDIDAMCDHADIPSTTYVSIFENTHVAIDVLLETIYVYVKRKTAEEAGYSADVIESTVKRWFKKVRGFL